MAERPAHPLAVIIAGDGQDEVDTSEDEDEGVVVACHWYGHAFALNGISRWLRWWSTSLRSSKTT